MQASDIDIKLVNGVDLSDLTSRLAFNKLSTRLLYLYSVSRLGLNLFKAYLKPNKKRVVKIRFVYALVFYFTPHYCHYYCLLA